MKGPTSAPSPIDSRLLWDLVPDGLLVVEGNGRIAAANSAVSAMFGHPPRDLIGRPVEALVAPPHRADHATQRRRFEASPHERSLHEGQGFDGYRGDRTTFRVRIALAPITLRGSAHTLAILRDVSDEVAAAQELAALHDESVQELFGLAMRLRSLVVVADAQIASDLQSVIEGLGDVLERLAARQQRAGP